MGKIKKRGSWYNLEEFGHEGVIEGVNQSALLELAEKITEHLDAQQLYRLSLVLEGEMIGRDGDVMEEVFGGNNDSGTN